MAKKSKADADDVKPPEPPFENEPSSLDETTHTELRMMHEEASAAILFAKNIQWRTVASSMLLFAGCVAVAVFTSADRVFVNMLLALIILLTTGSIFTLILYQFWQFNENSRLTEIEDNFSTLYRKIRDLKSRREGNFHRYTLLFFMIVVVVLGAVVAYIGIQQSLEFPPP